jgi:hypothetical protein
MNIPIPMEWNGEAMVPLPRFKQACDRQFDAGSRYTLEVVQERSSRSHKHLMATINTCWQTLPEHLAKRFPTPTHLRKWALIEAGYRNERVIVCQSKDQRNEIIMLARWLDAYTVILVKDNIVKIATAKSQSYREMGKKDFAASKEAIFRILAELLDVDVDTLAAQNPSGRRKKP